ncbi:MAG: ABC transporter ATP-binding protein [Campylobacterales bacterium]|nr:ABC transporter ATP-binding protein [Campylobacterales bacterium]
MIRLEHVCKTFHEGTPEAFEALRDISLHVAASEMVILKGISGSGKSTLLSIIGALSKPSSGSVIVGNQSVAKLSDLHASHYRRDTLGFIFQSFNLFEELSVEDNVALPLIHAPITHDEAATRINAALERAHIAHKRKVRAALLSGGEKQRCAIARALASDPKVLLCDEPTANLDSQNARAFCDNLLELRALGKTIIVATHDPIFETLEGVRVVPIVSGRIDS